jgi:glutathione S-transferase
VADIEILGVPFSNYVRSSCIALEEKGAPYTVVPCRAHVPEIDAIHPLGKIPCMRHGDFSLCETRAIAGYIDRMFAGPALFPADIKAAAVCEQWVSLANTSLIPVFQAYMVGYFFPRTPNQEPDRQAIDGALPKTAEYIALLDRAVGASGYLAGDTFSYADIAVLPILEYLKDLPESGEAFAKAKALPAYLATHAKRPSLAKTAPPPMKDLMVITHELVRSRLAAEAAAKR